MPPPLRRIMPRIPEESQGRALVLLGQIYGGDPRKVADQLVENSFDAKAQSVEVSRTRGHGSYYLNVLDDGEGVADWRTLRAVRGDDEIDRIIAELRFEMDERAPALEYVAARVADSYKRFQAGVSGEKGIGLLSFLSIADALILWTKRRGGAVARLRMQRDPRTDSLQAASIAYDVHDCPALEGAEHGTVVRAGPLHKPAARLMTALKLSEHLSSVFRLHLAEGRRIVILDEGRKLLVKPPRPTGIAVPEKKLMLDDHDVLLDLWAVERGGTVSVVRKGRIIAPLPQVTPELDVAPWNTGRVEGTVTFDAAPVEAAKASLALGHPLSDAFVRSMLELGSRVAEHIAAIEERRKAQVEGKLLRQMAGQFYDVLRRLGRAEAFQVLVEKRDGTPRPGGGPLAGLPEALEAGKQEPGPPAEPGKEEQPREVKGEGNEAPRKMGLKGAFPRWTYESHVGDLRRAWLHDGVLIVNTAHPRFSLEFYGPAGPERLPYLASMYALCYALDNTPGLRAQREAVEELLDIQWTWDALIRQGEKPSAGLGDGKKARRAPRSTRRAGPTGRASAEDGPAREKAGRGSGAA